MKLVELIPASQIGRLTLFLVLVQAIVVIALESHLASIFLAQSSQLEESPAMGIPVYLMIFVFSQVFQVILCWDAVWHQNTIQIIGFVIFNACTFAYSIFQTTQIGGALSNPAYPKIQTLFSTSQLYPYLIAISVILGISLVGFSYLAYKLYLEFGWKIYKKIGADPEMKSMYRTYQIFLMVLKLDFFFFLAFSIQFVVLVLNPNDPEYALTIIAIPVTVIVLIFAVYGLREENKIVMGLFMVGCLLAMAYFIFKLARMYQADQAYKYKYTRNFLTFFAALSLLAVTVTLVNAVVCFMNFDKGLKPHISMRVKPSTARANAQAANAGNDRKMTLEV